MRQCIFVFGSNLAGRHGKGAALDARRFHGAVYGQAHGLQGASYGIPTKDQRLNTLPLFDIETYVNRFKFYATEHPEYTFNVTRIGCGLAGYKDHQIAPMFKGVPKNVNLPKEWEPYL